MTAQLNLTLPLDDNARLEEYVGIAADKLTRLNGIVYVSGDNGKSHLLQGCCHAVIESGGTAIYLQSLKDLEPSVLDGLETYDLICLDDVADVVTDASWAVSLFQIINAVRDHGGKLVLAANTPVNELEINLPDLDSRLRGAYLLATDRLGDGDRLQIIKRKAERRGFEMSEEVCRFILGRARRDMHHLARLVDQLDAETLRQQKKVTIPFVKKALGL